MEEIDLGEFVTLMRIELEKIAKFALQRQSTVIPLNKSNYGDEMIEHEVGSEQRIGVTSEIEFEIQESLLNFAYKKWPFISVLTEEDTPSVSKFRADSPYYLLIDPIDGSKNYLAGDSAFCHTVSLMKEKTMLVSMIYAHDKKNLFVSTTGRGAWVFSQKSPPKRAVLKSVNRNIFLCHVSRIPSKLKDDLHGRGYNVRASSQNATDILSMLDKGIAGFISLTPVIYDVWSPAMIIQEAGGWLSNWLGYPLQFDRHMRLPHVLISVSEKRTRQILPILKRYV